jgi:hypothetical protein
MKALLVVVALVAPRLADAKGCHDVSRVVGYSRCSGFGWWSLTSALSWELGVASLRFDPKPIDTSVTTATGTYHLVAADDRPITAFGGRFRSLIGFPHQLYLVGQFDIAPMTSGPQLVVDYAARGGPATSMLSTTGGFVSQDTVAFGVRTALGPITVGGELGPGMRIATWSARQLPDEVRAPAQLWLLLEARAKADVWLSPDFSLGFAASTDVLRTGDYAFAITLALHAVPYDGLH